MTLQGNSCDVMLSLLREGIYTVELNLMRILLLTYMARLNLKQWRIKRKLKILRGSEKFRFPENYMWL